jgi:hypothetical protein
MKGQDYQISITVNATAHEAFKSISSVSQWWTEDLEGSSQKLNDEFTVRFGDIHASKQKLIEVIPDKKVVWLVTDSKLNFLEDKREWTNTKIVFEILTRNNRTQIRFTHIGLVREAECYDSCVKGWDQYIKGSLFKLLIKGKGTPALK